MEGQRPSSPDPEGEIPLLIQKIRKGSPNVPVGRLGEGEPYQGVPRRMQSCPSRPPNKTRTSEKKRRDASTRYRDKRFGLVRSASCRNFFEIAAAGTAGGLRAAFPSFWVAPEAQRG